MGNAISLALAVGVPVLGGGAIGLSIRPDIDGWYKKVRKPKWNPPNWVFGPVWTVLYSAMGVASWRVWQAGGGQLPLTLYGIQLALNFLWSPLFFKKHDLNLASLDITVLLGVLAATIVEFNKVDPFAAQLLLPYLGWTTFATALTYWIGLHNTREGKDVRRAVVDAAEAVEGVASEATAAAATPFLNQSNEVQGDEVPKHL
ncbi:hypothetical protein N2152v2_010394 [Parachlorella kessleri]